MADESIPQPVPALIQHKYLRPVGGGPCVECGRPTEEHEPLPAFVSITRREEESLKAGLPAWMVPLWDGIHAWAANLRTGSLKKHCEGLAKRVERIPDQAEASVFLSVVVERAIAAERVRISRESAAGLEAHVRFGKELAGCAVDCNVDATGAEWVPLSQARDAAERQRQRTVEAQPAGETYTETEKALIGTLYSQLRTALDQRARLAEENAKLKAALKSAALLTDEISKEKEAIQSNKRARIRREMLLAVHEQREIALRREQVGNPAAATQLFADIIDSLDRIVPGEG